jgi:hypothetical protein
MVNKDRGPRRLVQQGQAMAVAEVLKKFPITFKK